MTEAELDRRLCNGEAVEAALELFAENQRLLSSEPSEGERETRRRVAGAAFDMGASIAGKRDAEIAALKRALAEYEEHHGVERLIANVTAGQDAEIAALKAQVTRLTTAKNEAQAMVVDIHRALGSPSDVSYEAMAAYVDRLRRALAAGPAALRKLAADNLTDYAASLCLYLQAADDVEAAQAAAMKEEPHG